MNDSKVILISGNGGSGKTRMAREIAEGRDGEFKVFYWDSMRKSPSWIDAHKGDAQTIIIEGLTLKAFRSSSCDFLKYLIDESEQYLIFTLLTDRPLPDIGDTEGFSRFDRIIDLNKKATE